jgi:hypothetical protein
MKLVDPTKHVPVQMSLVVQPEGAHVQPATRFMPPMGATKQALFGLASTFNA